MRWRRRKNGKDVRRKDEEAMEEAKAVEEAEVAGVGEAVEAAKKGWCRWQGEQSGDGLGAGAPDGYLELSVLKLISLHLRSGGHGVEFPGDARIACDQHTDCIIISRIAARSHHRPSVISPWSHHFG